MDASPEDEDEDEEEPNAWDLVLTYTGENEGTFEYTEKTLPPANKTSSFPRDGDDLTLTNVAFSNRPKAVPGCAVASTKGVTFACNLKEFEKGKGDESPVYQVRAKKAS